MNALQLLSKNYSDKIIPYSPSKRTVALTSSLALLGGFYVLSKKYFSSPRNFLIACDSGSNRLLYLFFKNGIDVNSTDTSYSEKTGIELASSKGHLQTVSLLMDNGTSQISLLRALNQALEKENCEVAYLLLESLIQKTSSTSNLLKECAQDFFLLAARKKDLKNIENITKGPLSFLINPDTLIRATLTSIKQKDSAIYEHLLKQVRTLKESLDPLILTDTLPSYYEAEELFVRSAALGDIATIELLLHLEILLDYSSILACILAESNEQQEAYDYLFSYLNYIPLEDHEHMLLGAWQLPQGALVAQFLFEKFKLPFDLLDECLTRAMEEDKRTFLSEFLTLYQLRFRIDTHFNWDECISCVRALGLQNILQWQSFFLYKTHILKNWNQQLPFAHPIEPTIEHILINGAAQGHLKLIRAIQDKCTLSSSLISEALFYAGLYKHQGTIQVLLPPTQKVDYADKLSVLTKLWDRIKNNGKEKEYIDVFAHFIYLYNWKMEEVEKALPWSINPFLSKAVKAKLKEIKTSYALQEALPALSITTGSTMQDLPLLNLINNYVGD